VAKTLFRVERRRTLVGLTLMAAQAFFYNAIFFTYALVLTDFYGIRVRPRRLVSAALRRLETFLGRCFSAGCSTPSGRRTMIAVTYAVSGLLLAGVGYLFALGVLSATGQTIAWMVIFFFASAAASSAYLTVSETFPLEVRALAIAFFYAIGTGIGGVAGTVAVRRPDRYRLALERFCRLPARLGAHVGGGVGGSALRRRRRAQVVGEHQPPARRRRLRSLAGGRRPCESSRNPALFAPVFPGAVGVIKWLGSDVFALPVSRSWCSRSTVTMRGRRPRERSRSLSRSRPAPAPTSWRG
jgi:hypothetical protein